jgi:hypothetical protein
MKLCSMGAIAACLGGLCVPAYATVTSSATAGPLTFTLYDLAPNDGITPSISFLLPASGLTNGVSGEVTTFFPFQHPSPPEWITDSYAHQSTTAYGPVSGSVSQPMVSAASSISSGGTATSMLLSASGQASGGPGGWTSFSSGAGSSVSFALSPYTLVSFSVAASVHATTVGQTTDFTSDDATGQVQLIVSGSPPATSGNGQGGGQYSTDNLFIHASYHLDPLSGVWIGENVSDSGLLGGSYTNATNASKTGSLSLSVGANGDGSMVTAVPEPDAGLMMAGGMGVLALLARLSRRRRRGASRRMKMIARGLLCGAIVGAAAPAMAAVSSSASSGPVTITLYDLDLNDGVTPWISFLNDPSRVLGSANGWFQTSSYSLYGASSFGPVAGSAAGLSSYAQSAVVGDGTLAGLQSLSASGNASGANPSVASDYSAFALVPGQPNTPSFTLSSHTLVVFETSAQVAANVTTGINPDTGLPGESATGRVQISVAGPLATGGGPGSSQSTMDWLAVNAFGGSPENLSQSGHLSASLTNLTAGAMTGTMTIEASANGFTSITAVPEPPVVWLCVTGLLALGISAQVKKRGQSKW